MEKAATIILFLLFGLAYTSQAQVDYEEDIQPIFDQHCVNCHGSSSGVDLSSYNAVMSSVGDQYEKRIVIEGEPDQSPLVDKIEPNPEFVAQMPLGNSPLSNDEISLIRTWIEEGANEMAVSIEQLTQIPDGFEIIGNYPNPFNPGTAIRFKSPQKAIYNIDVYNSRGMLVRELSGTTITPQTEVELSMNDLASGVYLYRTKIRFGTSTFYLKTHKMTLTK